MDELSTGISWDEQRELDEELSAEDDAAIERAVTELELDLVDSPDYDDGPEGHWDDDEDELVEDDSDDDPDADFSDDELLTEDVDYGDVEEGLE